MSKKTKPHQTADATKFNSFAEEWIIDEVDIAQALTVPGVANLLLEHFNNSIIDAYDSEMGADDDDEDSDGHEDNSGRLCSCGRKWAGCTARNAHEHGDA